MVTLALHLQISEAAAPLAVNETKSKSGFRVASVISAFAESCCEADRKQLAILKSPVAPNAAVRYTIDESGIVLTDDDIEFVNILSRDQQRISSKNNFLTSEITGTADVFTTGAATSS
ncbi:uncharacterized protein TNCT_622581 [Trichonephila clavata]|uniref:Uncharacterized protein n=1 Tax=Trichonephila clavata TaxID=2740835 RepID=A0A8X6H8G7_TRICU|nr:uncharacterized protein TNCT_622581 [Trichonephila clavata]